jgi:hypothetical protein
MEETAVFLDDNEAGVISFFLFKSLAHIYTITGDYSAKDILLRYGNTDVLVYPLTQAVWANIAAGIRAPQVEGEYEVITVMDYKNIEIGKKEIRLITVVDPEGYIYEKIASQELRVSGAKVFLFWQNPQNKQYELWPAKEYQQENPQTTDITGKYSFLVPQGNYYLKVEAKNYQNYESERFDVLAGGGVHSNIELKPKNRWLKVFDWKTLLLVLTLALLFYNFYRDRKREK